MPTDTSERGLETLIESSLLNDCQYTQGNPNDYDRAFCVDRKLLFEFFTQTQPIVAAHLGIGTSTAAEDKFLKRLSDQIQVRGVVDVLRRGIREGNHEIKLYYPNPPSGNNPTATKQYASNIFSITRQVRYSSDHRRLALDMVIFINGIPLITFELKNNLTKQNVEDAKRQYQNDRDPNEPLFKFKRCLVHFAVDDQLVYMTTHLRGADTDFLPFNKGDRSGAGNPVNPNGIKTDYLWKQILTKTSLSNIIEKFAQLVEEVDADTGKKKQKLIFPRYHQLDVVRSLLVAAHNDDIGARYLIQHSAGSGKSNSISWLAHQLVELSDHTETRPVFDSVIIVTDKRSLDRNIRDQVKQFENVKGVVEAITQGSGQLRHALEDGKKIITTTIQKFPFVLNDIRALGDKRFAILIDEAHSSQSGTAAAKMNLALGKTQEDDEAETFEDQIIRLIQEQRLLPNASYFAFTATPKNKTLELFGLQNPADGKFYPFHAYSMRQAIEEEFILDVLQNYTTYQSYYNLLKKIEDDPKFDRKRAKQKLKRYVEGHPEAIRVKAEIMVDHFLQEVIAKRKVGGRAKAMIVTRFVVDAIAYKRAFDAILQERNSPYQALVAFEGSRNIDGQDLDETKLNGFPSADIPNEFKKDHNRFLIVAEKYQTGFDQPLLHTMYVDKTLSDVKAVQTLSRLNRAYKPFKTDTFVLDFVNSAETIRAAFEPYYETTILSHETDVNRLNDLQDALDVMQVYSRDQVQDLMQKYLSGAPRSQLDPILDTCAETYKTDLDPDQQIDFKTKAKMFVRTYQFLVLVLSFENPYWESLRTFLWLLLPKLPAPDDKDLAKGVIESVDMQTYRVEQQATIAIKLQKGAELDPSGNEAPTTHNPPDMEFLSNILQEFNERYGKGLTNADASRRFLFEQLPTEVAQDEEYQNTRLNNDRQTARYMFEKKLGNKFQNHLFDQTELYRRFTQDREFRDWLTENLFRINYRQPPGTFASQ